MVKKRRGRTLLFLSIITLVSVVMAAAVACQSNTPSEGSAQDLPPEFDRMAEVWELLEREHINGNNLDPGALSEGAIRGMLLSLDDPYASYLDAQEFNVQSQDFKGFFEGIGAQVAMQDGQLTIIAPLPDTPAEESGILPGDVILEINGDTVEGLTLLEAVTRIRGEEGTTVDLLVLHEGGGEPELMTVERGVIRLDSVRFRMLPGDLGHLRITNFSETTPEEVNASLEQFRDSGGDGLILDLRNNPGGLLSAVVDVASEFLSDGLVLYEINAQGDRKDWEVESGGQAQQVPMVVLINQFSASASEVLAGALIDHDRATVIGTTSFGKGSVNSLRPLSDGSGVYFTIARWYTPDGALIEGEGITPDMVVEAVPENSGDAQLETAVETLQQKLARGS